MIHLKILCLCLCAFFFNMASAYVLLNCNLTEEGKTKFKASIQSKYECSLSSDHAYVLHGAGEDFSSAWDDAVEACSKVYASQDECGAMIAACEAIEEVPSRTDGYGSNNIVGSCECLGPVQGQSVCGKVDDYYEGHTDVEDFIGYHAKRNCKSSSKTGLRVEHPKAFPINCNFDELR